MEAVREEPPPTTVTGTVMRLDEDHHVAFHTRKGTCWIAEFHGERAELIDAATWVRTIPRTLGSHGRRAAALATTTDLTPELRERIEALHRRADAAARAAAANGAWGRVRRWCAELAAGLRRSTTPRLDRS